MRGVLDYLKFNLKISVSAAAVVMLPLLLANRHEVAKYTCLSLAWASLSLLYLAAKIGYCSIYKIFNGHAMPNGWLSMAIGVPILLFVGMAISIIFGLGISMSIWIAIFMFITLGALVGVNSYSTERLSIRFLLYCGVAILILYVLVANKYYFYEVVGPDLDFKVWGDEFPLGTLIDNIARAKSIAEVNSSALAGVIMPAYHFGSYTIAAFIKGITGISGLEINLKFLTLFWLVQLMFCLGAVFRALGISNENSLVGAIWAIGLPDAFQVGMGNNYLGWHFNTLISPSILAGEGISLIAILLLSMAAHEKSKYFLGSGMLALIVLLAFKVHLIFLIAPYYFVLVVLIAAKVYRVEKNWHAIFFLMLLPVLMLLIVQITKHYEWMPLVSFSENNGIKFFEILKITQSTNSLYEFFVGALSTFSRLILLKLPLYLFAFSIGLLCIPYAVVVVATWFEKKSLLKLFVNYSGIIILGFILNSILFDVDQRMVGTPDELLHRPFVIVYLYVMVCIVGYGLRYLEAKSIIFQTTGVLFGFIACFVAVLMAYKQGDFYKINSTSNMRYDECVVKISNFINPSGAHVTGAILTNNDNLTRVLSSLTGLQPYFIKTTQNSKSWVTLHNSNAVIANEIFTAEVFEKLNIMKRNAISVYVEDANYSNQISHVLGVGYDFTCGKNREYKILMAR